MRILIACEYSGRMREAFRARGHDVTSVDLLPAEDDSPHHWQGDVFEWLDKHGQGVDLMIAHPTCTYLANSGVHLLRKVKHTSFGDAYVGFDDDRVAKMKEGAEFFAALFNQPIPKIAVENPVMHGYAKLAIEHRIGRPMETKFVQPWWYGDKAFKATGFTLKNLPVLKKPATALVPPKPGTDEHKEWTKAIANLPRTADRWKIRSRTFPGIARACAEAWG